MDDPQITVHGDAANGAYRIALPGKSGTAELTWRGDGDVRAANHTYVPPSMRGHGIAGRLVRRLVEDAREQGFKVDPQCSYVAAAFRRHPEWADLQA